MAIDESAGDGVLSPAELQLAISGLVKLDMLKLERVARGFGRLHGMDWEDLLHEAIVRGLSGRRRCPRELSAYSFLVGAMKSIVSANRKSVSATRSEVLDDNARAEGAETSVDDGVRKDRVSKIFDLFEDDPDATLWLMARLDTASMAEAQSITGFDPTKMNTIGRRIRRRIERELSRGAEL